MVGRGFWGRYSRVEVLGWSWSGTKIFEEEGSISTWKDNGDPMGGWRMGIATERGGWMRRRVVKGFCKMKSGRVIIIIIHRLCSRPSHACIFRGPMVFHWNHDTNSDARLCNSIMRGGCAFFCWPTSCLGTFTRFQLKCCNKCPSYLAESYYTL